MERKMQVLFNNLCCSQCKNSFDDDSITVKREEAGLVVVHLECTHCGKRFGVALLGFSSIEVKEPLEVQEGPEPINFDDVIDAHRFIQELDENWREYLPKAN
jgi:hypothetical protein